MELRVFITNRCDMRCTYCKVRRDGRTLDWTRFRGFLEREGDELLRTFTQFQVLGGEPLLSFQETRAFVTFLRSELSFPGPVSIFTNALNLGSEEADFLEENRVRVSISLDGLPGVNEKQRMSRDPTAAQFERATTATAEFRQRKPRVHVTLTQHNISGLDTFLDHLISLGLRDVGLWPADYQYWSASSTDLLRHRLEEVLTAYHGRIRFGGLERFSPNHGNPRPGCHRVYLGCDGVFYLCKCFSVLPSATARQYAVGDLETGIDMAKRQRLLDELSERIDRYEANSAVSVGQRNVLPYIYCPINALIYADDQGWNAVEALENYYTLMIAFTLPFLRLVRGGR